MTNVKTKKICALLISLVMLFTVTGCAVDTDFIHYGWDGVVDGETIWENEKRIAHEAEPSNELNEEDLIVDESIETEIDDSEDAESDAIKDGSTPNTSNNSNKTNTSNNSNKTNTSNNSNKTNTSNNSNKTNTSSQSNKTNGNSSSSTQNNSGASTTKPTNNGDVVVKGTRGGIITFHMNTKTYDCIVPEYYLSTGDVPALKTLLKLQFTLPEEARQYITTENGYEAIGPISVSFKGDTFSTSGKTLTFGNKQTIDITVMGWNDIPLGTPAATASGNGMTFKIIAKGGGGNYDCPLSTFTMTAEQCRSIGLAV